MAKTKQKTVPLELKAPAACRKRVTALVRRFAEHREELRRAGNETELRVAYLNPFFEALGWDMRNVAGWAEPYKEVVHEAAVKVKGKTKAPDYSFRIGGQRKFFLEAKKPSVDIEKDSKPAYQLRRYAWSAKLKLSLLSDFEELAVYQISRRPRESDKASLDRVAYYRFDEYLEKLDEIYSVFSKDAVYKGSFDRFAAGTKKKRGTAAVDDEFLREMEGWREELAKNLALRNPALSVEEMNFSVQAVLDRILFLRIAEDRGIEEYGKLKEIVSGEKIYRKLTDYFRDADDRYNAGLFDFKTDTLTLGLKVDDKTLKDIILGLYYPRSPYEFQVLGADILGSVYERFLGSVIRLTAGHRAKVEQKPEVRKAGGVYYTPKYIVDYIVKNTVSKQLKGLTPKEAAKLKILDPACGSGSFLLGAYQELLNWHLDWYVKNDPRKHTRGKSPKLVKTGAGQWRLSIVERKRILLNNIFGVDIDAQAVEVTKLNLLLKVLEGESREALAAQLKLIRERALPNIDRNIKCGNSLIGPDYWEGKLFDADAEGGAVGRRLRTPPRDKKMAGYGDPALQRGAGTDDERSRINAFDWKAEFPEIMKGKNPGFDCVIGNPPYVRMEAFKDIKQYLKKHYQSHEERSDIYTYFVERGHGALKSGGSFGMIVSNKFIRSNYGRKLRKVLQEVATIEQIVDFAGLPVFKGATVRTVILLTSKGKVKAKYAVYNPPLPLEEFRVVDGEGRSLTDAIQRFTKIPLASLTEKAWLLSSQSDSALLNRLNEKCKTLVEYVDGKIYRGVVSGLTKAFVISSTERRNIIRANPKAKEIIKPFLQGRNIKKYRIENNMGEYLIYTHHGVDIKKYPAVEKHLLSYKSRLVKRATKQTWYELQQPQFNYVSAFEASKIIFPDIATECRFALDESGFFGANTMYFIPRNDRYLLGLLNSKLAYYYFKHICAALEGTGKPYLRFFGQYLKKLPIRVLDLAKPTEKKMHDKMVALVERMLTLKKQEAGANPDKVGARTPHAKETLEREISATDAAIDALVYTLYGLTEKEIKVVES